MFKSIRWKITVIFVLLVLATELFIGGFNILCLSHQVIIRLVDT